MLTGATSERGLERGCRPVVIANLRTPNALAPGAGSHTSGVSDAGTASHFARSELARCFFNLWHIGA